MMKYYFILTIFVLLISTSVTTISNVYAGQPGNAGDCYEMGQDDGKNRPFKQYKFEDCEGEGFKKDGKNQYYEGFIDGCMDADNSRETCERFIE